MFPLIATALILASSPALSLHQSHLALERPVIVRGAPAAGILYVRADQRSGIDIDGRVNVREGLVEFDITHESGSTMHIDLEDDGICISWGAPKSYRVEAGDVLAVPVFVMVCEDKLVFDELGTYTIEIRLTDGHDQLVAYAAADVAVVEGCGDYESWSGNIVHDFIVTIDPFSLTSSFVHAMQKRLEKYSMTECYGDAIVDLVLYQSHTTPIRRILGAMNDGTPEDVVDKIQDARPTADLLRDRRLAAMWRAVDSFVRGADHDTVWAYR